jgi:hypothetical protein
MSKVTKTQLQDAMDTHSRRVRVDYSSCVTANERDLCADSVRRSGSALMGLLAQPLRATVTTDQVSRAESLLDASFHLLTKHEGHGMQNKA